MVGVLLTVVGLWIFGTIIGFFDPSPPKHTAQAPEKTVETAGEHGQAALPVSRTQGPTSTSPMAVAPAPETHATAQTAYAHLEKKTAAPAPAQSPAAHMAPSAAGHGATPQAAQPPGMGHNTMQAEAPAAAPRPKARGFAFVAAALKPMEYELQERFYGWRPNDILDFTDNVNSFQLGVLEVTRRTVVNLTERISRTGSTDSFDPNLENAMNWFMIKATRYWFPSPESKYEAGLDELRKYLGRLNKGQATFHTRPDNLIPLLAAYEDLLGSCDENLVKMQEEDGSPVSFFKSDDYFFYAKGIASAMLTIMEAVAEEFHATVETRRGVELLHHAIESLHHATQIDPWLITNADLSGVLANHRANMAAPISHARFYIGALIKTLST
ncbi:MAG: DUF2333 family protein [Desulfobacterales bacterium]|nr:DUF2333 family protein [Desulfobacterales bacterium]